MVEQLVKFKVIHLKIVFWLFLLDISERREIFERHTLSMEVSRTLLPLSLIFSCDFEHHAKLDTPLTSSRKWEQFDVELP